MPSGILFCLVCGDDVTRHRDAGCARCACACTPVDIVAHWWASNGDALAVRRTPSIGDFERELREVETRWERSCCTAVVVRADGTPIARRQPFEALTPNTSPLQPHVARTVNAVLRSVLQTERPLLAVVPPATLARISALPVEGGGYAAVFIDERSRPDIVALAGRRFSLSDREREILRLHLAALPTRVIGESLGIAAGTVRVHTKRLVKKARAGDVHELIDRLAAPLVAS